MAADELYVMKDFDRDSDRPPSPLEAAIGIYLLHRDEMRQSHPVAFSETVRQLLEMYGTLTPLQANLVAMKAIKACPPSVSSDQI